MIKFLNKKNWLFLLFTLQLLTEKVYAQNAADDLLLVIGLRKQDEILVNFQTQNGFNSRYELPEKGVKLYLDENGQFIKTIVFTNAGYTINDKTYKAYNGLLPLNVSLNYKLDSFVNYFGKILDTNTYIYHFKKGNIHLFAEFNSLKKDARLECVSYTKEILKATSLEKVADTTQLIKKVELSDNGSAFRRAILTVFKAAEDPSWSLIIQDKMQRANFWNYKFTYSTNLKIPGEKYNMIYAFPFENSQRDFVSVLDESKGGANASIKQRYEAIKNQIRSNFPESEGWLYSYEKNKEEANSPYDMKLKKKGVGTLVLDYSKSPYNTSVLYLRFLFEFE